MEGAFKDATEKMKHRIVCGDCIEVMQEMESKSFDLVVTSPPYDNLREYTGYVFDFENVVQKLYRLTKEGGVIVWVVGDATINGSETGTSFKQALYFKEIGFNLHDTMIYQKSGCSHPAGKNSNRYSQIFEFMFVFSKNKPKTVNLIKDKQNRWIGTQTYTTKRQQDGSMKKENRKCVIPKVSVRNNIWRYKMQKGYSTKDTMAFEHPAIFPEALAKDHIISWSNEGDTVLDPMCGSGTTLIAAERLKRNSIGIEISKEYCELSYKRLSKEVSQLKWNRERSTIEKAGF